MTCFMVLGWQFPVHIFDLHTAYLAASNILLPYDPDEVRQEAAQALVRRVPSLRASKDGNASTRRRSRRPSARAAGANTAASAVFEYCEEDVRMAAQLLRAQLRRRCDQRGHTCCRPPTSSACLHWSEYSAKAIALIQMRGMPIDTELWGLVQENKPAVIKQLLRQFDPSHGNDDPIFDPRAIGATRASSSGSLRAGFTAWPRLDSGQLDIEQRRLGS